VTLLWREVAGQRVLVFRSIMKMEFEWHEAKAATNLQLHGVSFELAKTVFKDAFAIERLDDREDYGEERFVIIGMAEGHIVLFVAYTETRGTHPYYFSPEGHAT
jgi:uncharacterized DUF497 family protein